MPVTVSYHAGSREGVNSCGGQRVLGRRRRDHADEHRLVNAPMNQQPRQRCDRPFIRAAGFLGTVMVQIISRIPPTSSDSVMTIPPPVIGIQDESQQARRQPAGTVGAMPTTRS